MSRNISIIRKRWKKPVWLEREVRQCTTQVLAAPARKALAEGTRVAEGAREVDVWEWGVMRRKVVKAQAKKIIFQIIDAKSIDLQACFFIYALCQYR